MSKEKIKKEYLKSVKKYKSIDHDELKKFLIYMGNFNFLLVSSQYLYKDISIAEIDKK